MICDFDLSTHEVGICHGISMPPIINPPPVIKKRTGRPSLEFVFIVFVVFNVGAHIAKYKQSSEVASPTNAEVSVNNLSVLPILKVRSRKLERDCVRRKYSLNPRKQGERGGNNSENTHHSGCH